MNVSSLPASAVASPIAIGRAPKMPPDMVTLLRAWAPRSSSNGATPSVRTRHS